MIINRLNCFKDSRGVLSPMEFSKLPFTPKRCFFVTEVPKGVTRGNHAHFKTEQYLICLSGNITVGVIDSEGERTMDLSAGDSVYIPKLCWDYQVFNTGEDILFVLASTEYNSQDYIRDKNIFEEEIK